jgi:hypothetical protein
MNRKFRVYFNRHSEFPQIWSVDEGTQESEINVIGFVIHRGCYLESRYNGDKPNDDSPCAWIEVQANDYYIKGGIVHFVMHPADGRP